MNDDGYPLAKIPRHPLNTYNIGTQRPKEKATTEQLSMLNAEKYQMFFYYKAFTKYEKMFEQYSSNTLCI